MKYIAAIEYSDYDSHEIRYLTFEGTEEELAIFAGKLQQACEWYKDSLNTIVDKFKTLTIGVKQGSKILTDKERKVVELLRIEARKIRNITIDGIWVDLSFICDGMAEVFSYEVPQFTTLNEFFENQKQYNVSLTNSFKIRNYDNTIAKEF